MPNLFWSSVGCSIHAPPTRTNRSCPGIQKGTILKLIRPCGSFDPVSAVGVKRAQYAAGAVLDQERDDKKRMDSEY